MGVELTEHFVIRPHPIIPQNLQSLLKNYKKTFPQKTKKCPNKNPPSSTSPANTPCAKTPNSVPPSEASSNIIWPNAKTLCTLCAVELLLCWLVLWFLEF